MEAIDKALCVALGIGTLPESEVDRMRKLQTDYASANVEIKRLSDALELETKARETETKKTRKSNKSERGSR